MSTTDTASQALDGMREGLAADGYELVVTGGEGATLDVEIRAGENACAECLVPKDLMGLMIVDALPRELGISDVRLRYPTDTR